jgi:intergrase/recombinase
MRYAKKYSHFLLKRDFSELNTFSNCKRNHVLKALSALAKFLGMYEEFKGLMKSYGLKWSSVKAEDLIISRLTNANGNSTIFKWISEVKSELPKLEVFLDFVLVSGLRYNESIRAYNLIIELAKEGKLSEYYNEENGVLEHFRFKQHFIRRTKKAFISFIPKQLIERISKSERLDWCQIQNWIKRKDLRLKFSDVREFWATYMTKHLRQPEIDFLQGRVSASVFMRNYFNPALIIDLKERVFKGIADLKVLA